MDTTRSSFSKFESGNKKPTLNLILTYHLLFDIPLSQLIKDYLLEFKQRLEYRIDNLILVLKEDVTSEDIQERIHMLQDIVERIGCLQEHNEYQDHNKPPHPLDLS